MDPIGLYLHIPFCIHKCGYCDFNSHPLANHDPAPYVDALAREIVIRSDSVNKERAVGSIFFGGGTPTVLPKKDLIRLLNICRDHFSIEADCEITVEANPGTIAPDFLPHLRETGFNRISVGVQSFDLEELKLLERIHSVEEVTETVRQARDARFGNLSLDLMFALPDQSRARWEDNLEHALALEPDHLSCYNLMIEPNTAFKKLYDAGRIQLPDEDHQLELFQHTIKRLRQAGFDHYEISNFAKPGRTCRHNILYWHNGDHLGLGAGASSFLNGVRSKNIDSPTKYVQDIQSQNTATNFEEELAPQKAMGETLMLGLRLLDGVNVNQFERRYEVGLTGVYEETLTKLLEQNLITLDGGHLALSQQGLFLADSVILEFIA